MGGGRGGGREEKEDTTTGLILTTVPGTSEPQSHNERFKIEHSDRFAKCSFCHHIGKLKIYKKYIRQNFLEYTLMESSH